MSDDIIYDYPGDFDDNPATAGVVPDHVLDDALYQPFPIHALPQPLKRYVVEASKAIGCNESFIALALLTACAGAVGNTRRLRAKKQWDVTPILWTAIVGDSGVTKSPALDVVRPFLSAREEALREEFEQRLQDYQAELLLYQRDLKAWQKQKSSEPPPEAPEAPEPERCLIDDTTVEAVVQRLKSSPRGLTLFKDELSGWFGSFDKYSGGSTDSGAWLSMHSGKPVINDRKQSGSIHVKRGTVSLCGGIQPWILKQAVSREHRESGLLARLLPVMPPVRPKRWTEAEISDAATSGVQAAFDRLWSMCMDDNDDPLVVAMSGEAKEQFVEYFNAHNAERESLPTNDLKAAWGKLEETPLRLALILHCIEGERGPLQVTNMERGIEVAKWFKEETKRVYAILNDMDSDDQRMKLVEFISGQGGSVTAREVLTAMREFKKTEHAEAALLDLVTAGIAKWETVKPDGAGRPTRKCTLIV